MYGYGYRYNSGLVLSAGGGAPFANISSLSFDGVDDYVDCGNITELNSATAFTISGWYKQTTLNEFRIFFGAGTGLSKLITCYTFTDGRMYLDIRNGSTTYGSFLYNSVVNSGEWFSLVCVFNGGGATDSDKFKLYINGSEQTLTYNGTLPTVMDSNLGDFTIGENTLFAGGEWLGNIDEVCILDRVVTPAEIVTLSTAPTVDLTDLNPIAWYRMGDNGSWKSPQWLIPNNENFAANKVSNYSFQLDGVDDFIDCGNGTDLQITNALTLSVWTKLSSSVGTQSCIISKDNGSSQRAFSFWGKIVNKPVFYIWNGATSYNVGGTTNIADDTWHHVAVVYVPSTSIRIYVDGVLEGTNTTSIPASINNANYDFKLGHFGASLFEFKGLMDEVSVFNSDQSANIATLYNSGTPTTLPSGAVAHWRMGEDATFSGGVWTVPDNVGSNNGTSNAMTIEDRIGEAPNSENNAVSFNMDEVDRVNDTP